MIYDDIHYKRQFEISDSFKRIAFDKNGEKTVICLSYHYYFPFGNADYETISDIVVDEIKAVTANKKLDRQEYTISPEKDSVHLEIGDPIALMIEKCQISKTDAKRIHSVYPRTPINNLQSVLTSYYDDNTKVGISWKDQGTERKAIHEEIFTVKSVLEVFGDLTDFMNARIQRRCDNLNETEYVRILLNPFKGRREVESRAFRYAYTQSKKENTQGMPLM